jgi:hypothetical protein
LGEVRKICMMANSSQIIRVAALSRSIHTTVLVLLPANSVPRGRGVRGAARGLERELKCPGATQKKE